jgi:methionine aminopeptidase
LEGWGSIRKLDVGVGLRGVIADAVATAEYDLLADGVGEADARGDVLVCGVEAEVGILRAGD